MSKMRHQKRFLDQNLKGQFIWIKNVQKIQSFIPSAKETYRVEFTGRMKTFEFQRDTNRSERTRFEEFAYDFFEVDKNKNQVLFCWREWETIMVVF